AAPDLLDQPEPAAGAEPPHCGLRRTARRRQPDEEPEGGVPEPAEAEKDDPGRALVDQHEAAAHRAQAVLDDDLALRVFGAKLLGENTRGQIVPLPDARSEDQHAAHASTITLLVAGLDP